MSLLARTKIVATLGPASSSVEVIGRLVEAGADVFRLNFSHGTHQEHGRLLSAVRECERRAGRPLGVLQDLCGPKIRLGSLPVEGLVLREGERVRLTAGEAAAPGQIPCPFPGLAGALAAGQSVLLADGAVALRVERVESDGPVLVVEQGGRVRSRQGLNVPDTVLDTPSLTAKDREDLEWGLAHGVDWIALSFVRSARDVEELREQVRRLGGSAGLIAKIEKPQALGQIDAIVEASDALMVARGDLGVEVDVARVPAFQKSILAACRAAGVPAITATQMLASMETSSRPTRAEASDVYNAVLDGSDAVMLSGETAAGAHPVEAVATMNRIVLEAERVATARVEDGADLTRCGVTPSTAAIVIAARAAAERIDAALIGVVTRSGRAALALSCLRPRAPILAIAEDLGVARRLSLAWGVTALHADLGGEPERAVEAARAFARANGLHDPGRHVVLLQGRTQGHQMHDSLLIREMA